MVGMKGGFTDGKQTVFNKNAALFNVKEENLVNLGEILPIPLCQSYQPLVQNNSIYSSGYIFKNTHPIMNRFMEGDYIWKIENGNLTQTRLPAARNWYGSYAVDRRLAPFAQPATP